VWSYDGQMRLLVATVSPTDALLFCVAIGVALGAWWMVLRSSVWAIRRLLASDLPRPAAIGLVAVTPVAMIGGGWFIFGMYRLGWWPSRGRTRTTDERLRSWLVAAVVFWLGATALVEAIAGAIATTPQPDQTSCTGRLCVWLHRPQLKVEVIARVCPVRCLDQLIQSLGRDGISR
jgi:hypothetical protein